MKRPALFLLASCVTVGCLGFAPEARSADEGSGKTALKNPFFTLCMDTHDAKKRDLKQQAEMLAELGYGGAAHLWLENVPERLKTLDEKGLKLYQVFVRVNISPQKPNYDPKLAEVIKLLKGRPTILGLLIGGGKPSDSSADGQAVAILREIADMAAASNIRVALYPHTGDWIQTTSDAVRVVKKVDRKNVGAMFNLCHTLKVEGDQNLEAILKEAAPYLFVVTINGADKSPGNWDRLIQPLGSGSLDVGRVLRTLAELGYSGPIGLQCYGIGGDAQEHLKRSMAAWKVLSLQSGAKQ